MHSLKNINASSPRPVLDGEVASLVDLCAGQIGAAIDEAFRDVDTLSRSFLDTARHANSIQEAVSRRCAASESDSLRNDFRAIQQAAHDASTSLQFADRLSQRLSNVSSNLVALAELMRPTGQPVSAMQWSEFLEQVRAVFTMEQERQMFDAVFAGTTIAPAAEQDPDESADPEIFEEDARDEQ